MKKFLILFLTMFMALPLIAQVVDPPTDIIEVITNLDGFMGTLVGLAGLAIFISGLVIQLLSVTNKIWKQVISWLVPILLALVLGVWLNIGFLAEETIWVGLLYGLGAGLVSNGLFDIPFVKALLTYIFSIYKKV